MHKIIIFLKYIADVNISNCTRINSVIGEIIFEIKEIELVLEKEYEKFYTLKQW